MWLIGPSVQEQMGHKDERPYGAPEHMGHFEPRTLKPHNYPHVELQWYKRFHVPSQPWVIFRMSWSTGFIFLSSCLFILMDVCFQYICKVAHLTFIQQFIQLAERWGKGYFPMILQLYTSQFMLILPKKAQRNKEQFIWPPQNPNGLFSAVYFSCYSGTLRISSFPSASWETRFVFVWEDVAWLSSPHCLTHKPVGFKTISITWISASKQERRWSETSWVHIIRTRVVVFLVQVKAQNFCSNLFGFSELSSLKLLFLHPLLYYCK